ncbi:MAG: hypothetical protein O3B74_04400 [Proteobacteria bacterium]|nr:hypothetical protein [Pseudomonadota bacterium]MDA1308063.1 hypothetical protein [Pseudomonadota bacterium]
MHEGFLVYGGFRYLKLATLLSVVAIAVYGWHVPPDEPNGGTWLGYGLGSIGAALILWLMWFGIRKRRYGTTDTLQGWLSAHVYLGLSLIIVATLHTGFQFGWNLHTLAYSLMMLVIASGFFGIYAYARYPQLMTENRRGVTTDEVYNEIGELDRECRQVASALPDAIASLVLVSCNETRIGGSVFRQLSGVDANCGTTRAFDGIRDLASSAEATHGADIRKLISLIGKKSTHLRTMRRDVQLKALLEIWLYFHVPMSFALLAALAGHVLSVFYYW